VEFAEITGVPVVPTLMGWGAIPDDHPLMAGMVGLQTSHRYGNATMLAIRLRARHRQPLGQPPHRLGRDLHQGPHLRARRHRADADRPRLRARLRHRLRRQGGAELFVEVAASWGGGQGCATDAQAWAARAADRKRTMLRKTHFDDTCRSSRSASTRR
jgi:tartronate-semialdehyde synthase